jgi:hypothetical protein
MTRYGIVAGCGAECVVVAVCDGAVTGGYVMVVDVVSDAHRIVVQLCMYVCLGRVLQLDTIEQRGRWDLDCAIETGC